MSAVSVGVGSMEMCVLCRPGLERLFCACGIVIAHWSKSELCSLGQFLGWAHCHHTHAKAQNTKMGREVSAWLSQGCVSVSSDDPVASKECEPSCSTVKLCLWWALMGGVP